MTNNLPDERELTRKEIEAEQLNRRHLEGVRRREPPPCPPSVEAFPPPGFGRCRLIRFAFEPVYMGERMSHTVRDPRSE